MCDHCGCREFPPIAELTADHERILHLAWALAEAPRAGAEPDETVRRDLLELLDRHVAKEETGLYPELTAIGAVASAAVDDLEAEHDDIRRSLTEGTFDRRDYYALAAHIEDEEMELFPAAMLGFDDEEWEATRIAHRTVDTGPATVAP
ncbi:hemerythrin domain-containing protein [Iamia sp. SCSIO 61187]|uniref:hemerythrin domain-containing protein n=1 Tax=Iamia sp. SCSIO 61187 TaxID=2722752 RepID=UPI001C626957|nr:hemerythrin domain-containing protein [Iamia sp. SCSIO 61187]QYG95183.1 hemerythrin domain-containing protein [Iamia sp. SCSIO 61187]